MKTNAAPDAHGTQPWRNSHLPAGSIRSDLEIIAQWVPAGARVLDVGCGDGALLAMLRDGKGVDGRGIEISRDGVTECLGKGLSVVQGDADRDLHDYPDHAFDVAILSQTIQATQEPRAVLENLLRIGDRAIVSFPNFAHWRARLQLAFGGRMPVNKNLPYAWYDTPNIHFCTISDFRALARTIEARVCAERQLNEDQEPLSPWIAEQFGNIVSSQALFLLARERR